MSRPLWNGSIAFGLVQIPVGLYSAEESDEVSFTMLDKRDFSPVGYERFNKKSGAKVAWGDIVKGYEYEKGQYVVFSDEELANANVEAAQTIDLAAFVGVDEIDPMYIERPIYVVPKKQGLKAYRLLLETMEKTKRAGIAQVVLRTRQHLAALVPRDNMIVMLLLRYAHEIRPAKGIDFPTNEKMSPVSAAERKMAEQLVSGMAQEWAPEELKDTYHDDVMELAHQKIKSGKTKEIADVKAPKAAAGSNVVDLAALLAKSLERPKTAKTKPHAHRAHAHAHKKTA